jgi:GGDEF domain-containing protein
MKYAKFERLVILIIVIAVAVMAAAMAVRKTDAVEIAGHLLMIGVIISSLYWGKKGALLSFSICLGGYTAARLAVPGDFSSSTLAQLIAAKLVVYGLLAFICMYMRTQFRYFFVKLEREDLIDDETQVGNERFLLQEITSLLDEYERYGIPFSLVEFAVDSDLLRESKGREGGSLLRDISVSILKNDTRSVDELARFENRLVVLLPNIGREGAEACGKRLASRIEHYLENRNVPTESFSLSIYSYPRDEKAVEGWVRQLRERAD